MTDPIPALFGPLFDAHFHIIDTRFPLVANNGFMPAEFTAADYLAQTAELGITGGVVVSGSFQELDTTYLVDALQTLGSSYVGVANVADDVTDAELLELVRMGVRGVRFNLYRGGSAGLESAAELGQRAWTVAGMHSEFYLDARDLSVIAPVLTGLPKASIDHLGMRDANRDVLLTLVEAGVHVKATGFGRLDFDVAETIRQIYAVNGQALMFGSDLPGTRAPVAFQPSDLDLIRHALPDDHALRSVLHDNAALFYQVDEPVA